MSIWTHVTGSIRLDGVHFQWNSEEGLLGLWKREKVEIENLVGRQYDYYFCPSAQLNYKDLDYDEKSSKIKCGAEWAEKGKEGYCYRCEERDLPGGSEGSLRYEVVMYGHADEGGGSVSRGSILFWGDLRDYSETKSIEKWFQDLVDRLEKGSWGIRDLSISVHTEFNHKVVLLGWDSAKDCIIKRTVSANHYDWETKK